MRTIILLLALTLTIPIYSIQQVLKIKITSIINSQSFLEKGLRENFALAQTQTYTREFKTAAIKHLRNNFQTKSSASLLRENQSFEEIFNIKIAKSSAHVNLNGESLNYYRTFKNAIIPFELIDHPNRKKGWALSCNSFQGRGKGKLPGEKNFWPHTLYFKIGAGAMS